MSTVILDPEHLDLEDVLNVARQRTPVSIPDHVLAAVASSRQAVERLAEAQRPVYGVSTGFGALAQRHIPEVLRTQLQKSLVRSHAAGMGEPVEPEVVRAMMLLRARTLATGRTGVRPEVLSTYVEILNAGLTPVVHEYGSLGCSGDLAPLSACALVLMGEGEVLGPSGQRVDAAQALSEAGVRPVTLAEKEGLALINGTDGMLGMLLLALADLENLLTTAELSASLSVQALLGTDRVFAAELFAPLRPHPGQTLSAANMRSILEGSELVASHRHSDHLVQDAYSLRCAPQVTGAARDSLAYAEQVALREMRAAIDNPVILDSGDVSSNGNFHGAPLAHAMDFLAITVADVASIAERRTDRMMDPHRNQGMPPFLAHDPGVDSGLMIAHYTQVALVAETKRIAQPASVDSIPSSAMQEDHVSMGWHAGRKLRRGIANLQDVLAVELCASARAADLREEPCSSASSVVIKVLRAAVPGPGEDRFLSPELAEVSTLVGSGAVVRAAEGEVTLQHTVTP